MEFGAEAVKTMKYACLGQLAAAAIELGVDAIGSVVTLGLSDAAAALQIEIQNGLLDDIIKNFIQLVESKLVNQITGPLKEQVDRVVVKLLFEDFGHLAVGGPPPGLTIDTATMRTHADAVVRQAEANLSGGHAFRNRITSLTYTTGG